jgi:putative endonuclease
MIDPQKFLPNKPYVYVLRSQKDAGIYIGSTRNLPSRLKAHQHGKVKSTKGRKPLELVYIEEYESYSEARKREIYLKSGAGREFLKDKNI